MTDPYPSRTPSLDDADCGMCLTPADIGVPGPGIAYAHPGCPFHGSCPEFVPSAHMDDAGRGLCGRCGAYADEHFRGGPIQEDRS